MTNCPFPDISELRDVESLNLLRQAAESGRMDWAWRGVRSKGRDNAHTPMQWDASPNGGFTGGAPWIMVNPNVQEINVAAALRDPDSVLHYYRALLALRREQDVLRYGDFRCCFTSTRRYLPMRGLLRDSKYESIAILQTGMPRCRKPSVKRRCF